MTILWRLERKIVFWAGIGHFCNHVGNYLTPALLIYLQTDIFLTQTERGLLGSIPMAILVFLSSIAGSIGDHQPKMRKHLIWLGIVGIGVSGLLMSLANSFIDLAIGTILLGFTLSTYHPNAFTYLNTIPNKDRNMGINAVLGNFGSAITPLLAMIVAVFWGWREAYIIFSILQIVIGLVFAYSFPNDDRTHLKIKNWTEEEKKTESPFTDSQIIVLNLLLVAIMATRAPIFRCLSYFTTIVFRDAYHFSLVDSSIFSAFILNVGASATFIIGLFNNRKSRQGANRNERVGFRINTILLSISFTAVLLLLLVLIPEDFPLGVLVVYIFLSFFFFLGAAVLPPIMSEISSKGMGRAFGILFGGATLTGAIAPTIFGYLADTLNFSASFLFLGFVAILCIVLILAFKFLYKSIARKQEKIRTHNLA